MILVGFSLAKRSKSPIQIKAVLNAQWLNLFVSDKSLSFCCLCKNSECKYRSKTSKYTDGCALILK